MLIVNEVADTTARRRLVFKVQLEKFETKLKESHSSS